MGEVMYRKCALDGRLQIQRITFFVGETVISLGVVVSLPSVCIGTFWFNFIFLLL